jgi:chromosome segregation ATPase
MKNERDALEDRVAELESENRLMRQQYFRRLEERDALKAERDALKESVKDLLDLTEYGDIDAMVWELVNDGDKWVVERLNRAQRLIDKEGE